MNSIKPILECLWHALSWSIGHVFGHSNQTFFLLRTYVALALFSLYYLALFSLCTYVLSKKKVWFEWPKTWHILYDKACRRHSKIGFSQFIGVPFQKILYRVGKKYLVFEIKHYFFSKVRKTKFTLKMT